MKTSGAKKYLRVAQVADELNCSMRTVYRLIAERQIPAFYVRSSLRIAKESLDLFIRRSKSEEVDIGDVKRSLKNNNIGGQEMKVDNERLWSKEELELLQEWPVVQKIGSRNRDVSSYWSEAEKNILKDWISKNPTTILTKTVVPSELKQLLPKRTLSAILAGWYKFKVSVLSKAEQAVPDQKQHDGNERRGGASADKFDINVIVNAFIETEIQRRLATSKEVSELKQENENLKELMRKLTPIREAVETFQRTF